MNTTKNTTDRLILELDGFTLEEKSGRYVMTAPDGRSHDISSDPAITSHERLSAHWAGFYSGRAATPEIPTSKPYLPTFAEAKKAATRYKVECNKDRAKGEVYFVGSDIAARPAVFLRDKEIGRTYCVRSFEYADA